MADPSFIPADPDFTDLETEYSLPSGLLSSVMRAESNGNIYAVSNKKAKGPFQFIDSTAKQYGVTDPFDLSSSAKGAAKYFRALLDMHDNDLPKAIASYNWGEGNVKKHGLGKAPPETQVYLNKVLSGMPSSDFIPAKAKSSEPDFIPAEAAPVGQLGDTIGAIGKHIGGALTGAAKDVTDTALAIGDILAPVGTALGGIAAMGQPFGEAEQTVQWWANELNPTNLAKKFGYTPSDSGVGEKLTKMAEVPMGAIADVANKAGEYVAEHGIQAGPAMVPPSPELGAAVNVATQALPFAVAHKAGRAIEAAGEKFVPKPVGERPAFDFVPAEAKPVETVKAEPIGEPVKPVEVPKQEPVIDNLTIAKQNYNRENTSHTNNKLSPEAWDHFEKGDVKSAIEDFRDNTSHPVLRLISNRLLQFDWEGVKTKLVDDLGDTVGRELKEGTIVGGRFSPDTLTISLSPKARQSGRLLLHEAVHAVTARALSDVKSVLEIDLKNELGRILDAYDSKFTDKDTAFIGVTDRTRRIQEFAAEIFTNDVVLNRLKDITDRPPAGGPIRTLYNSFVKAITRYLGINTLGERAVSVMDQILSQSNKSVREEWGKGKEPSLESPAKKVDTRDIDRVNEQVRQLLASSKTQEAFERAAKQIEYPITDKQLKDAWANKDAHVKALETKPSTYSQRTQAEKVLAQDTRNWDQFHKEVIEPVFDRITKAKDDIGRWGKWVFGPRTLEMLMKRSTESGVGAQLVGWAASKIYGIDRKWDRVMSELLHGKPLTEGSVIKMLSRENAGVLGPVANLTRRQLAPIARVWLDLERNNKKLRDKGLQWADDEMLSRDYGLNAAQRDAYRALANTFDKLYDIVAEQMRQAGLEPPKKIPGYYPHYAVGNYRIHLKIKDRDGKSHLVEVIPFRNKHVAEAFIKEYWGNDPSNPKNGFFIEKTAMNEFIEYSDYRTDLANLAVDLKLAADKQMTKGRLSPLLRKRLDSMISRATTGHLKSALERSGKVKDYIGAEGIRDTYFGELIDTQKMMGVVNQYARSVIQYAKSVDYQTQVWNPILEFQGEFSKVGKDSKVLENTFNYANELLINATNKHKRYDNALFNAMDATVPKLNQVLLFKALSLSPKFVTAQTVQGVMGAMGFLPMYAADLARLGVRPPSATKAITKALNQMISLDAEGREALGYATKNHITDTAIWESLQRELGVKKISTDAVNKAVDIIALRWATEPLEKFNRGMVFLQGYYFFKDAGFSKLAAYEAADKYVTAVMGDYSKTFRPLMTTNLGPVGRMYSPFATLMNTYIGNLVHMTKGMGAEKAKNYALAAGGAYLTTQLIFSGIQGLPGMQEWQALADQWNDLFPEHPILSYNSWIQSNKVPDWLKYGVVSNMTKYIPGLSHGINIGQSLNAPSITGRAGIPSVPMAGDILGLGIGAGRSMMFGEGMTAGEQFRIASRLAPPALKAGVEHAWTTESGMVPVPGTSLKGFMKREPSDWAARYLGGRSLTEEGELASYYLQQSADRRNREAIKRITDEVFTEIFHGSGSRDKVGTLLKQAIEFGGDPDKILEAVTTKAQERNIEWRAREIMGAGEGMAGTTKMRNLEKWRQSK